MATEVTFYGQLSDITQVHIAALTDIADTNELLQKLYVAYPTLQSAKFITAVNNTIISENTFLNDNSKVALMPPFSGG